MSVEYTVVPLTGFGKGDKNQGIILIYTKIRDKCRNICDYNINLRKKFRARGRAPVA
ncbi:hypothetical protein [Thermococcus sp.]